MSDRNIADLDPVLQPLAQKFIETCKESGITVILTETYRSSADQDADYAKGRTTDGGIITNARGGQSPHNCTTDIGAPASKAFDFAIIADNGRLDWDASDAAWTTAISIGESLGLVSGSTWHSIKDWPHFELPNFKPPTIGD